MRNPFAKPGTPETERQITCRERFKTGVCIYQGAMVLLLAGLLIHGYFAPPSPVEIAGPLLTGIAEMSTNAPVASVAHIATSL
jgi:hypothetical protein